MKQWTEEELKAKGYDLLNGKITATKLTMEDYGCLSGDIVIEGCGCGVVYGGYCLGHGYLGAKEFTCSESTAPYLMRIMDTVGVNRWEDLNGKYVRWACRGLSDTVKIIGNIIDDKWFDAESFFEDYKKGKIK